MQITDVRITKSLNTDSKIKATASVTLDDSFVIHGIKYIKADNGNFISFPSKKTATNEYRDIAHPINASTRILFQNAIEEAYNKLED